MNRILDPRGNVSEMQGLYGSFSVHERVLQRIWQRGDFIKDGLRAERGGTLEILDPGHHNLQEGPDFKEARLRLDGRALVGDVEIHFNQRDWWQHQHATAKRFNGVVLHVVLNPPSRNERPAQTRSGVVPEVLVLLPLLNRDLEAYAEEESLLECERLDELEWAKDFLDLPYAKRVSVLKEGARSRWKQKRRHARLRLDAHGWDEACHQMVLECLGYRRNREAMGRIALRWPLSRFLGESPEAEELFIEQHETWRLAGLRPANHPLRRLKSYCQLVKRCPDWPGRAKDLLEHAPATDVAYDGTGQARKTLAIASMRKELGDRVFHGSVGPAKLNTLVCDVLLPLADAAGMKAAGLVWFHWYAGDVPYALKRFLRRAGIVEGSTRPHCNGWNQGALALLLGS